MTQSGYLLSVLGKTARLGKSGDIARCCSFGQAEYISFLLRWKALFARRRKICDFGQVYHCFFVASMLL
jgi:hypothetical protein